MKITAFNGSMRGEKSITSLMLREFLQGAQDAGAETEHVILVKLKINSCRGCLNCWLKTPGACVQKDDVQPLLKKYMESDIVVFATPVYVENVTGLMKNFIDRLIPITDPRFEMGEHGETRHYKRYDKYPGIVAMSNSGFVEQTAFDVLRLMFKRVALSMNGQLIAEIYRGGGGILGLDQPGLAPLVDEYKALMRKAGAEVVNNNKLSDETIAELEKQIIPTEIYNAQVNAWWDMLMAKAGKKDS